MSLSILIVMVMPDKVKHLEFASYEMIAFRASDCSDKPVVIVSVYRVANEMCP